MNFIGFIIAHTDWKLFFQMLVPVLVPAIIRVGKGLFGQPCRMLRWTLPFVAPIIGAVLYQIAMTALGQYAPLINGAVLGAAGVCLREVWDQATKAWVGGDDAAAAKKGA